MANELNIKPCPFCGGAANAGPTRDMHMVECDNAACAANPMVVAPFAHLAIERWQARASQAPAPSPAAGASIDTPEFRNLVDAYVRFFMTDEPGEKGEQYWAAIRTHANAWGARLASQSASAKDAVPDRFKQAYDEFMDKTEWIDKTTFPFRTLGLHRADILRQEIERLRTELSEQDRLLRASVSEDCRSATSPVGAVQNYIGLLEQKLAKLGFDANDIS